MPSGGPNPLDLIDLKDVVSGALGNVIGAVVLLAVTSSLLHPNARSAYAKFFRWVLSPLSAGGRWFVDKWQRLRTPLDRRGEAVAPARPVITAKSFHDRQIGAPTPEETAADEADTENRAAVRRLVQAPEQARINMEALGRSLKSAQLSVVAKASRPKLPASWKLHVNWDELGEVALENLGPGDASHVLVRSPISEAGIRSGYWPTFPKEDPQQFKVEPGEFLADEDFYVRVTWHDEADEEQCENVSIPR